MEFEYSSPINYFKNVFKDFNLKTEINRYLILGIENESGYIRDVDYEKGIIYLIEDQSFSFEQYFVKILNFELSKSKSLIDNYLLPNINYLNDYLIFLKSELQYIINNNHKTFYRFPFFISFITELRDYINNKFITNPNDSLTLNIPNFNIFKTDYANDDELLHIILGYLKDKNEKRENIMSKDDFDFLISAIKSFINNSVIDIEQRKIENAKISQSLLSFTFWVLHKHLYGTRPRRKDFLYYVKNLFTLFDGLDNKTFEKKFGSRESVTYKGLHFIPKIIKQELEDRN